MGDTTKNYFSEDQIGDPMSLLRLLTGACVTQSWLDIYSLLPSQVRIHEIDTHGVSFITSGGRYVGVFPQRLSLLSNIRERLVNLANF